MKLFFAVAKIMYNVKLENFEGPLDLLLELINKNKLDINDISLAQIANQYLEYLEDKSNIDLNNLADFLTIASNLILIKSKSLLPLLKFTEEEEEEIADLKQQIKEYKKFKEISVVLKKIYEDDKNAYSRELFYSEKIIFRPPKNISLKKLENIYGNVLKEIPVMKKLKKDKIKKIISLKKKIINLQEVIRKKIKVSFDELIKDRASDRTEVVVSFLAILEMIKQNIIIVEQANSFDEIILKKNSL